MLFIYLFIFEIKMVKIYSIKSSIIRVEIKQGQLSAQTLSPTIEEVEDASKWATIY